MALNPLAAEFVPHGLKKQELAYTGWGRDGFSLRNKGIEYHEHECGESSNSLSDIPKEASIKQGLEIRIDLACSSWQRSAQNKPSYSSFENMTSLKLTRASLQENSAT